VPEPLFSLPSLFLSLGLSPFAAAIGLHDAAPAAKAAASKPAEAGKELIDRARGIQTRVETLRGQKLAKPLRMGVKSKADVTRFIQERLKEEYGPDKVLAEGQMLKLLGLRAKRANSFFARAHSESPIEFSLSDSFKGLN
jgi:hypothetical protein